MQAVSILIVENDFLQSENLKSQLEKLGYQVVGIATKGEDAIAIANETKPDLVFMDIELDGTMDGIETANQIYKQHQTPIVYLSQFKEIHVYRSARRNIKAEYVPKPPNLVAILNAIENLLYKEEASSNADDLPKINDRIFVKNGNGHYAVFLKDIIYIEANREVSVIHHTTSDKPSTVSVNLGALEDKLKPFDYLARCSRYHMVNLNKVTRIKDQLVENPSTGKKSMKKVVEVGEHTIVVSDNFRSRITSRFHLH